MPPSAPSQQRRTRPTSSSSSSASSSTPSRNQTQTQTVPPPFRANLFSPQTASDDFDAFQATHATAPISTMLSALLTTNENTTLPPFLRSAFETYLGEAQSHIPSASTLPATEPVIQKNLFAIKLILEDAKKRETDYQQVTRDNLSTVIPQQAQQSINGKLKDYIEKPADPTPTPSNAPPSL